MKAKSALALFLSVIILCASISAEVQQETQVQERARRVTRENITTLMLIRMTRFLELTEDQTAKIYPFFTRIEKEKMQINQQLRKQMRELRLTLSAEDPDTERIRTTIQAIKGFRDALRSKDTEMEKHLEENLTVVQQGKYLVFVTAFFNELRKQLDRARMMRERAGQKKRNS